MKFDIIYGNPPYNRSIDIKILKEITPLAKELVIIHPSTWLIDLKMKKKLFNDYREQVNGNLKSVEMFNGNPVFGIGLSVPVVITHIDNGYQGTCSCTYFGNHFTVESIYDITKFGKEWFTIVKPFMENMKNWVEKNSSTWDNRILAKDLDPNE